MSLFPKHSQGQIHTLSTVQHHPQYIQNHIIISGTGCTNIIRVHKRLVIVFFLLTALIRCMRKAEKQKSECEKSKVVSIAVVLMGLTGGSSCSYKKKDIFLLLLLKND